MPSDGWAQLLVYRQDLFDAAGLAAPETYDDILAAAEELDSGDVAGFVGATVPNDAFTQQTFEHLALGNGCQMVDDGGEVALDSEQCVAAFEFYNQLITDHSVSGAQDVDTTRAAYFAGQAAMVVWSSFILDEMAGLRNDALPNCPECADDPAFLAENSGVVTAISGPDGEGGAQFGEVVSWATLVDAQTDSAAQFVSYMMEDGYEDWIGFSPEGKVPTRQGTADEPTAVHRRLGDPPGGRGHQGAAVRLLRPGGPGGAAGRPGHHLPAGASRRGRAPSSVPPSANCRCPRPSPR